MTAPAGGAGAAERLPPFLSSARLTGMLFQLPCDREVLAAWLRRFGPLSLGDAAPSPGAEYPVFCELWNVHDGALAVGRMDVAVGRTLGRAVGTYRECMVWVPDVRLGSASQGGGPPGGSFVAGMLTDSGLARWADVALGFGYDKRPGRFESGPGERWSVFGPSGREELRFSDAAPSPAAADVTAIERHLAAPLLGVTRRGAFVHSWLARSLEGASPRALSGELLLSEYLVPGARRHYSLTGERAHGGASAISFTAMKARVSYPREVL